MPYHRHLTCVYVIRELELGTQLLLRTSARIIKRYGSETSCPRLARRWSRQPTRTMLDIP